MSDEREMIVVVRDAGVGWVEALTRGVRADDCAVGLVTGPLTGAEEAALRPLVTELMVVDDPTDPHQVVTAASALCRGRRASAVLSASDGAVVAAARAGEFLGIGRTSAESLARTRDKYAARTVLRDAGLPVPPYALLSAAGDAEKVAAEVGLPAVLKPVNGGAGHLVLPVRTVDELADAYDRAERTLLRSPFLRHLYTSTVHDIDPRRTFLVEGMLTGREYSVDVVIRDGEIECLPLLDKFLLDERYFELGFVSPPIDLSHERETALLCAAEQAIVAHGLDNTVAHVELIDDARLGPTIVEVNAGRPGGLPVCTLVQWMTGVDTFAEQVSAARGVPSPRTTPRLPIPLGGFLLFPEQSGTLRAVHGLEEVREHGDVVEAFSTVRPGDELSVDHEIPAIVVVVAGFADEDDLAETYGEIRDLVEFEMES